ncbi:MAG: trans-sulfuration enzyme family protein [Maricaulaceae bacterium]
MTHSSAPWRPATRAVHTGHSVDPLTGAVAEAIQPSTTFARDADYELIGHDYARTGNPNRESWEACLTALEGGAAALAFASGLAAQAALFQAVLKPGAVVVLPTDMYHGGRRLAREVFGPWDVQTRIADPLDREATAQALVGADLLWIETPSNPTLKIIDIAALAELARANGALAVCDNTLATPLLQSPLHLGCAVVLHASTKYLAGHSDVTGGALMFAETGEVFDRCRTVQHLAGAVPSAFDCWLARRGAMSLSARLAQQSATALSLAQWLAAHPEIARVHYPGLPEHPGHGLAQRQMRGAGGVLSFELADGAEAALGVARRLSLIIRATSFGGAHSTIEHRASIEGPDSPTPKGLLRLSCGLEDAEDLRADLAQALSLS